MGLLIHQNYRERARMGRRGDKSEEIIGLEEAADLLHVHRHTIRKCVREGTLPALKLGRVYAFSRSAILELVRTGKAPKDEPEEAA